MKRSYGDYIKVCERKLLRRIHDYYTTQIFHVAVNTEIRREPITCVIRQINGKLEHKMPIHNYSLIHVLPRRGVTDNLPDQRHSKRNSSHQITGNACLILIV